MNVTVLMASGGEDAWEGVETEVDADVGGMLFIQEPEEHGKRLLAVYAPGMWIKVEFEHDES